MKRALVVLGLAAVIGLASLAAPHGAGGEKEKKEAVKEKKEGKKDEKEGRTGTTIGVLEAKGKGFIEVRADGEDAPRKYFPQWKGGEPAKGGGFDKETLKTFDSLKIGSRIEVQWIFEERLRALAIKVLAPPKEKK